MRKYVLNYAYQTAQFIDEESDLNNERLKVDPFSDMKWVAVNDEWVVYRLLDESRTVLYVGMTKSVQRRIMAHRSGKIPFKYAEYTQCSGSSEARLLERIMIEHFCPKYNTHFVVSKFKKLDGSEFAIIKKPKSTMSASLAFAS